MRNLAREVVICRADIPGVGFVTLCGRTVCIFGVFRFIWVIEVDESPGKLAVLVAIIVGQNALHIPV